MINVPVRLGARIWRNLSGVGPSSSTRRLSWRTAPGWGRWCWWCSTVPVTRRSLPGFAQHPTSRTGRLPRCGADPGFLRACVPRRCVDSTSARIVSSASCLGAASASRLGQVSLARRASYLGASTRLRPRSRYRDHRRSRYWRVCCGVGPKQLRGELVGLLAGPPARKPSPDQISTG